MLERSGYTNITYMVVNSQDDKSRRLHPLLQQRLSENITLYSQNPDEPDVWQIANVLKDDFQIYDRCGRLTYHLSLPYTILSQPYVEEAIRNSYCSGMCGDCALENSTELVVCNKTDKGQPAEETPSTAEEDVGHHGVHHRGHHRGHHGSGEGHSHDGLYHQHGHQGQVFGGQAPVQQMHSDPQVMHEA